eukprot:9802209-Ditylum_brightwellii.AAC.1
MSAYFPNIKFTECKPEPLGKEFNSICCAITGIMLTRQMQRGINNTVPLQFSSLNVITAVSLCLDAKTKLCGQEKPTVDEDEDEDEEDRISNVPSSDLFQGGSWSASISSVEYTMKLRHQFKGIVNQWGV